MGRYVRNRRWMAGARKADSKWEGMLRDTVLKSAEYHPEKVNYTIDHTYQPDFFYFNQDHNKEYLIETKGRFRESSEASKYKWVRKALPDHQELVFVFYKPEAPMPHAKKRKDGTKQSHAEWAEKNNFRWFTAESIKELL